MCRGLPEDPRASRRAVTDLLGQAQTTGDVAILRRLLRYADKVCSLAEVIGHIWDRRVQPRISTQAIIRSVLVMFVTRMGSLNALEQTRANVFWRTLGPSDNELTAARRLLRRVLENYPRAFDILLGDALYTDAKVYALLTGRGKNVLTVLKANQPDMLQEAQTLLETVEPEELEQGKTRCEVWDLGGFRMAGLDRELRVVRSRESRRVRRQLDGQSEDVLSEWLWVTTCSDHRAPTAALVKLGHARWEIENQGFNEAVNRWHADHVYKHTANACLTFWLMAMLAFNLFHVFYYRDLKPALRQRSTYQHVARSMASELYHVAPPPEVRPP